MDSVEYRHHPKLDNHLPQLLDSPRPSRISIAYKSDRLLIPFGKHPVERVLQHGGIAMIVLGRNDDVPIALTDLRGPFLSKRVRINSLIRSYRNRLVVKWQRPIAQVDEFGLSVFSLLQLLENIIRGFLAESVLTSTANNDLYL